MLNLNLGSRLEKVYELLNENETICDIGSDHGLLPIKYALNYKKIIYATEKNDGPFLRLKENVKKYHVEELVKVYKADGINGLPSDVSCISICGMGGETIIKILKNLKAKKTVKRIIIEPQSHFFEVRKEILSNSHIIISEKYCKERGHFYPIMEIIPSEKVENYSEIEMLFGKFPIENKDKLLYEYAEHLIRILSPLLSVGKIDDKSKLLLLGAKAIIENY